MSTPVSSMWVANEWRSVCAVIFFAMPACAIARASAPATRCSNR
jgi:hypothetical protein